jgi:urease accessory protein
MHMVTEKLEAHQGVPEVSATLPFEQRVKSRLRLVLDNGEAVGLLLPRGTILRGGDWVRDDAGRAIKIHAALENVSTVRADDASALARIAYHLGNRHMPLHIGDGWLRYARDHVLDAMVVGMGGRVQHEEAPFEPEGGAYAGQGHAHT